MTREDEPHEAKDQRVVAWLAAASAEDALFLRSLPSSSRQATLTRLSALLALEAGDMGVVAAGERAGMARSAFHKLRSRWKDAPGLRSIAPYATRRSRGSSIPKSRIREAAAGNANLDDTELVMARELVLLHSEKTNGAIARLLQEALPAAPKQQTAAKLVRRMRHELGLLPEALRRTYGKRLLVDLSALGLTIEGTQNTECPVAAFVIERASGLVLATEVARRDNAWSAFERSLRSSREHLVEHRLDALHDKMASATVVLPDIRPDRAYDIDRSDPRIMFVASGQRRFGQKIVSAIGPRVGRILLRSAYTLPHSGMPSLIASPFRNPLSLEDIDLLVREEVAKWNRPILSRLRDAGVIAGENAGSGMMAAAVGKIEKIVSTIPASVRHG